MQSPAIADSRHGEVAGEVGEASEALSTFHHLSQHGTVTDATAI